MYNFDQAIFFAKFFSFRIINLPFGPNAINLIFIEAGPNSCDLMSGEKRRVEDFDVGFRGFSFDYFVHEVSSLEADRRRDCFRRLFEERHWLVSLVLRGRTPVRRLHAVGGDIHPISTEGCERRRVDEQLDSWVDRSR